MEDLRCQGLGPFPAFFCKPHVCFMEQRNGFFFFFGKKISVVEPPLGCLFPVTHCYQKGEGPWGWDVLGVFVILLLAHVGIWPNSLSSLGLSFRLVYDEGSLN